MMDDLYITYNDGHGQMTVHMNAFFPTSQARLNKLLKIIELDWQHEDELKEKLKVHFQNKILECEGLQKCSGKDHLNWRQKEADTKAIVATKKFPNGVPLSKDELKQQRENLRYYKEMAKSTLSDFNRHKRNKEQYLKHLELL